jgi:hypothetical protein
LDYEILITRSDGKQTCMDVSMPSLDLLTSCAEIGYEGAEGNLAHIDDVGIVLDELKELLTEPEWSAESKEQTRLGKLLSAQTLLESAGYTVTVPTPAYCVDGHEFPNEDSGLIGDGQFPPFRVFNIEAQDYEPGTYPTRAEAQVEADRLNGTVSQ